MAWVFILLAVLAGLFLLPGNPLKDAGVSLPQRYINKRALQVILFSGLILAMLALRLVPFALLLLLVAIGVIGNSIWQERAVTDDLRDDSRGGNANQGMPPQLSGKMTSEEAYAVLGLQEGAGLTEIDAAYRKLMSQIHPDKGGTDYLAAKINEARDLLKQKAAGD